MYRISRDTDEEAKVNGIRVVTFFKRTMFKRSITEILRHSGDYHI